MDHPRGKRIHGIGDEYGYRDGKAYSSGTGESVQQAGGVCRGGKARRTNPQRSGGYHAGVRATVSGRDIYGGFARGRARVRHGPGSPAVRQVGRRDGRLQSGRRTRPRAWPWLRRIGGHGRKYREAAGLGKELLHGHGAKLPDDRPRKIPDSQRLLPADEKSTEGHRRTDGVGEAISFRYSGPRESSPGLFLSAGYDEGARGTEAGHRDHAAKRAAAEQSFAVRPLCGRL